MFNAAFTVVRFVDHVLAGRPRRYATTKVIWRIESLGYSTCVVETQSRDPGVAATLTKESKTLTIQIHQFGFHSKQWLR